MSPLVMPFVIGAVVLLGMLLGIFAIFRAFYVKVEQGTALIVNDLSATPKVRFTGSLVIPVLYKAELMRVSLITLQVDRRGKEGLICKDNMRADITVAFYLRVNETQADVLRVAKAIGAHRASDRNAVDELFNAKFSEALKTVGKKFEFTELFEKRQEFRDEIVKIIGADLNGYVLEDVAIDYLEQTPKHLLDSNNILDAEGIRKITERTATQNVVTNELEQNEKLAITKKNVEAREATLALERQQAEAEARQKREIETIRSREEAEAARVREEQRLIAEAARLETEEKLKIREQNVQREVEVAEQNRQRAVAIEVERVQRAKALEQVTTDREVQLQGVERDKVVEVGKKDVANITRERIAIDKTVTVEEERIKEVRVVSEAERDKQARVLAAEAAAQEEMVRAVKEAEAAEAASRHKAVELATMAQASEAAAKHKAAELATMAQAKLEAASREADAKRILAEASRVELAAPGLAEAAVREAEAGAIEKVGAAEARVLEAKAEAVYKQGSAEARVLAERLAAQADGEAKLGQAKATAAESVGVAEATVTARQLAAQAEGEAKLGQAKATAAESVGLAEAKVLAERLAAQAAGEAKLGTAKATAVESVGVAEANVTAKKLMAEAEGLTKKFEAIDSLSDRARQHEEFRMTLQGHLEQAMAAIHAGRDVSKENAEVIASALRNANIDLVGGDGGMFDSLSKALTLGKSIEGFAGKSPIVQDLLARFLGTGNGAARLAGGAPTVPITPEVFEQVAPKVDAPAVAPAAAADPVA
ncbi:flotillin family protein [Longimicrobium sp.]|uniref:flotillin family protein n=1 Tax=Longimicrobium sp. TaxID=2029185 RepID=UPI0039C97F00